MGPRRYDLDPIRAYCRPHRQLQAVLHGSISLLHEDGPDLLRKKCLWLCSPQFSHGWTGEGEKSAEVVVFQFLSLPEPLSQFATDKGFLEVPLNDNQCELLKSLALEAHYFWKRPAPGMILYHQYLLLELSWLIYKAVHPSCDGRREAPTNNSDPVREAPGNISSRVLQGHERVNVALHWFRSHLRENPAVEDVANAVGLSASQLRRLFQANMNASPREVFDQLRFQHSMELMSAPGCKISAVVEDCGFASASAFSRAFKHKSGISPDKWRG